MRVAIVSDINANEQAWTSVLADAELCGIEQFVVLGDTVGAGPAPSEVLESVHSRANWVLAGERDLAVAGKLALNNFQPDARQIIEWTQQHLSPGAKKYLGELPMIIEGPGFACAHAEFECPQRFSFLDHAGAILGSIESSLQPMLFVGHTRLPAVTEIRPNNKLKSYSMHDYQIKGGCRYLVNVGSVGDPRDGNPRACYCIYDTETYGLEFRRVAFDVPTWDVEISINELPIQPYVIQVLKRGASGDGGIPTDFIPGLLAEAAPEIIDFGHPRPFQEIDFGGALRTRVATTEAEFASSELDPVEVGIEEVDAAGPPYEEEEYYEDDEFADEDAEEALPVVSTSAAAAALVQPEATAAAEPNPVAEIAPVEETKSGGAKLIVAALACLSALGILGATIHSIYFKKKEFRPPPGYTGPNQPGGQNRPPKQGNQNTQNKPPKQGNQNTQNKPSNQANQNPQNKPPQQQPANDGPIKLAKGVLLTRDAKLEPNKVRFEKGRTKNFAVWQKEASISWAEVALREGSWKVSLIQSADAEEVEVEVEIDDQVLFGTFAKTANAEDLQEVELGQIILPKKETYRVGAKLLSDPPAPVRLRGIKFQHMK